MPQDPHVREKFTRERSAARQLVVDYFRRFPKDCYQTEVLSWRNLQSQYRIYNDTLARADRG
jgi:hypothetical protein